MHGERCGVCWSATECFENRSPHMPCGRGQRKQKPESNGRADGFPTRPRAREDIFRPRRTGVCGRPQQLTELILTAQTGRFSKIFGTLTRRQILNQIFENPGLAQGSARFLALAQLALCKLWWQSRCPRPRGRPRCSAGTTSMQQQPPPRRCSALNCNWLSRRCCSLSRCAACSSTFTSSRPGSRSTCRRSSACTMVRSGYLVLMQ